MNKQEVIKERWLSTVGYKVYVEIEPHINKSSGCLSAFNIDEHLQEKIFIIEQIELENGLYRPKSLEGFENNNGWVKIEADRSNLPTDAKDSGLDYLWFTKEGNSYIGESWPVRMASFISETHFRPLEKHQPPLY